MSKTQPIIRIVLECNEEGWWRGRIEFPRQPKGFRIAGSVGGAWDFVYPWFKGYAHLMTTIMQEVLENIRADDRIEK